MHPVCTEGRLLKPLPSGCHSEAALWEYHGQWYVMKRSGQYYAGFTTQEAHMLAERVSQYYSALQRVGIPVPEEYACWVEGTEICLLTRYAGSTLSQAGLPLTRRILEQVLDLWVRIVAAPENTPAPNGNLLLSIELSLDNMCQQAGTLLFIDFTPPLLKVFPEDSWPLRLIPHLELTEEPAWKDARYFRREGVLLTFLTKFWAACPEQAPLVCETLSTFLCGRPDGAFLRTFFNQSKATTIARLAFEARECRLAGRTNEMQALLLDAQCQITALGPAERDQLRLLALILMPESPRALRAYLARTTLALPSAEPALRSVLQAILALKVPEDHARLQFLVTALLPFAWRPFQV